MINKAIKILKTFSESNYKLCSIITDKKGRVLSIGYNSFSKTHPTQAYYCQLVGNKNRIFLHAEIDAIIRLPYDAKPFAIYIARIGKKGNPLLAKPCEICLKAINDVGIKKIVHT